MSQSTEEKTMEKIRFSNISRSPMTAYSPAWQEKNHGTCFRRIFIRSCWNVGKNTRRIRKNFRENQTGIFHIDLQWDFSENTEICIYKAHWNAVWKKIWCRNRFDFSYGQFHSDRNRRIIISPEQSGLFSCRRAAWCAAWRHFLRPAAQIPAVTVSSAPAGCKASQRRPCTASRYAHDNGAPSIYRTEAAERTEQNTLPKTRRNSKTPQKRL